MQNLDSYIAATSECVALNDLRHGGGCRALAGNITIIAWMFDILDSSGMDHIELDNFFNENPAFPSSYGSTASMALAALDTKLGRLYTFVPGQIDPVAVLLFTLRATFEEAESIDDQYDVSWDDITSDLYSAYKEHNGSFYHIAKSEASTTRYRNLNALLQLDQSHYRI